MKIAAVGTIMLLSGVLANCKSEPARADNTVKVCLSAGRAAGITVARAEIFAASMFKEIGVFIDWEPSRDCRSEAILVALNEATPSSLKPGAFAYALPYEGVHIQVFYDRICEAYQGLMLEIVLAHVLVHEITHILEGVKRHSDQGVMKANWNRADFFRMKERPLEFITEDIELIHQGLAERRKLATLAMNTEHSSANRDR